MSLRIRWKGEDMMAFAVSSLFYFIFFILYPTLSAILLLLAWQMA